MYNFPQITATKKSLSLRRSICGVGINDSAHQIRLIINDIAVTCPIYVIWSSILNRCYSKKFQEKNPTYKGCRISEEWKSFVNFKTWVLTQDWDGKELDKDIIKTNNKTYSKDLCIFVSNNMNALLCDRAADRGVFPPGVSLQRMVNRNRYQARCNVNGNRMHIGTFDTPEQAHAAYLKFKSNHVHEIALQQTDERLKQALIRISGEISRGEYYQ